MTEHDGLTAEQEAKRRWPTAAPWTPTPAQGQNAMHFAFVAGAVWSTEREKARAEAAEARVAELRSFIENWSAVAGFPDAETYVKAFKEASANYLARVCAPTTEAVTEVEGS